MEGHRIAHKVRAVETSEARESGYCHARGGRGGAFIVVLLLLSALLVL